MACKIELSNYNRPYFAGNSITGKVICDFQSFEDVQEICIKLKGVERVYWYENRTTYAKKNRFLGEKVDLASKGSIGAGRHEFPFVFVLPPQLPTSYTGRFGWVTYTLKAEVVRSLRMNYKHKMKIAVIAPLDQNKLEDRSLLRPGVFEGEKTLCCLCCAKGLITMRYSLEKKTFVPGELIKIPVKVFNKSHTKVKSVKAKYWIDVKSTVRTLLRSQSRIERFELAKSEVESGSGSHDERSYELLLQLPMMDAVPNFFNSSILSVQCGLEVTAVLPTFHMNLKVWVNAPLADIRVGGVEEYFARMDRMGVYVPPKKGEKNADAGAKPILRIMGV